MRRICGWRVKVNPGTYCASIVAGMISARGVIPLPCSVASDQFWPARKCKPRFCQSIWLYITRMRGVYELVSFEFAVWGGAQEVEFAVERQVDVVPWDCLPPRP